jgi:hypothetical protein
MTTPPPVDTTTRPYDDTSFSTAASTSRNDSSPSDAKISATLMPDAPCTSASLRGGGGSESERRTVGV